MNSAQAGGGRFRSYLQFVVAVLYFFLARVLARLGAERLGNDQWFPLSEQALLVVLLLLGYAGLGFALDRQKHPIRMQGLPRRPGMSVEAGLGVALGWGIAVVCVLPLLVAGGIAIVLSTDAPSWGWLLADVAFFALTALAEEIAFRGYGFQCFVRSVGTFGAVLGFAAFYGIVQAMLPGSNRASIAVSIALSLLLTTGYLRTRALWLSWGLNFGWKASRALVFGLAVSGVNNHSSVVEGDPMGPFWITGGGYGLDGSWVTFFMLLAALPVLFRLTRDLDFRYNAPVLVPGGIPVDLDAAAHAQHEQAMGAVEPKAVPLVQIFPAAAPPPALSENPPAGQIIETD